MKILILVLSSSLVVYENFTDAIRKTWGSEKYDDIDILYYYGGSEKLKINGNNVYIPVSESHSMIGPRTLEMFDYVLNNYDFDYIFRVNAGSYIRQDNMIEFLKDKPKENFYCGIVGKHRNIKFASGSGYFLSKNLVEILVKNKSDIKIYFDDGMPMIDDVAVAKMISEITDIKICDSATRCDTIDNNITFCNTISDEYIYHYRIRSDFDRNSDIQKIYNLHDKYKK